MAGLSQNLQGGGYFRKISARGVCQKYPIPPYSRYLLFSNWFKNKTRLRRSLYPTAEMCKVYRPRGDQGGFSKKFSRGGGLGGIRIFDDAMQKIGFLRLIEEYIISPPPPAPHPQPRTHRAAAYRALVHGPPA